MPTCGSCDFIMTGSSGIKRKALRIADKLIILKKYGDVCAKIKNKRKSLIN